MARYKTEEDYLGVKVLDRGFNPLERFNKDMFEKEFQQPYGFIYLITNLVNDKVYVGKTTKSIFARFLGHLSDAKSTKVSKRLLYQAIREYGETNFEIEEVCSCSSADELAEREIYYIKKYKSKSYNCCVSSGRRDNLHYYDCWVLKFGKEKADELNALASQKKSLASKRMWSTPGYVNTAFSGYTHTKKVCEQTSERMIKMNKEKRLCYLGAEAGKEKYAILRNRPR
jgi:group I intron endonuclease